MNIVTIIQARTSSTRLPGKVLLKIAGKTVLELMMERVLRSRLAGTIVVATTTDAEDNLIEDLCKQKKYLCFRGDKNDLLDRHFQTAKKFSADIVLKIPSDCPLIDPDVIDKVIQFFLDDKNQFDFVSNLHPATYPDGNDVEVMTMMALEKASREAKKDFEREHTTPFIWENPQIFKIGNVEWESGLDYSMTHRFTFDYKEDYDFIKKIYEELYPLNPNFTLKNILDFLKTHPAIFAINQKYAGVNWYRNHLNELKTIHKNQTKQTEA
jgi:spore coat polysaccharide biosynthesis protein SpsF